jgi:HK97 family phage major capsid protein
MMGDEVKQHLLGKIKSLTEKNKALLDVAQEAHRDLTDDEMAEWGSNMKSITQDQVEVKSIEQKEQMQAQLDAIGAITEIATQDPEPIELRGMSIGEAFVNSVHYKAAVGEFKRTGEFPSGFKIPALDVKAAGDATLISTGNNADAIRPWWDPTLYTPSLVQLPLTVRALMSQVPVDSNVGHYPTVVTRTAPSGNPTSEGAAKKGVEFAFDDATVTLEKNTAFGGMSDEFFADAPALAGYITTQIGLMVDQVEEAAIAAVLYAAASTVDGSTVHASSPNGFDAIRAAMVAIQLSGGVPDGILIYPTDAGLLDTLRSASSDEYYGGGPVGGPRGDWWGGLRLVITAAADPGRPLVGAFRAGATLYTRGGTTVETSTSHDDWFASDKIAVRAYRRSKAVKHYPEWFKQCDIGAS